MLIRWTAMIRAPLLLQDVFEFNDENNSSNNRTHPMNAKVIDYATLRKPRTTTNTLSGSIGRKEEGAIPNNLSAEIGVSSS